MVSSGKNCLGAHRSFALDHVCQIVDNAFDGSLGIFHVGSSLYGSNWRDVDIRLILKDEEFDRYFGAAGQRRDELWSLMCMTITKWMSDATSLPIDFQIQRMTEANKEYGEKPRNAFGIFLDYPGTRPTDLENKGG